jgi:hypothetical protein
LGRRCCCRSVRDKDVHLQPDELGGERDIPIPSAAAVSLLDDKITALGPPEFF